MIVFFFGGSTYASFEETLTSSLSLTIVYFFLLALNSLFDIWQYVLLNYFFAYTITLIALIFIRIYSREKYNFINRFKSSGKRTVIYGAGSLGLLISKQIIKDSKSGIKVLGFIDDNLKIKNYRINKFKVLGDFNKLKEFHEKLGFELILLAIKDISIDHLEQINSICEELKIELKIVPSLRLILNEGINYTEMKAVQLSDILGRKNISSTSSEIKTLIKDKKILVTGAGGSIGSEIVRQLHNYSPEIVGCLDRDESALHALELSLFGSGLLLSESMILADLRDQEAIDKVIEKGIGLIELNPE